MEKTNINLHLKSNKVILVLEGQMIQFQMMALLYMDSLNLVHHVNNTKKKMKMRLLKETFE